ncbi:RHS repeat domain-containing protein [Microbulbifer sp. SSSA002]|uniref:RHS repeat domain-containing protein n=1 Tax=Microbulbifer sp. SSSA002 TaxID=3243376 RepID=UPI00403A0411
MHDSTHNILAAASSEDEAKQQSNATQVKGNRLASRGNTHYRYDIHGNRIAELRGKGQKLQTRYHYNAQQQLVQVVKLKLEEGIEQLQQEIHYQYDPLGRRVGKSSNSEYTNFLWDGDVLLRENKADIHTRQDLNTRTYYFEPGTFKPVALKEEEQVYHYHLDHLGTPDTLTNQEGEVVWSVAYKSYGNIALAHKSQIEQSIRFQGQYFDEETGLHYNRFRYYDPEVGEFTQQDPVGLLGGSNSYQYVPNPVEWVDPSGLTAAKEDPSRQVNAIAGPQVQKGVVPDSVGGAAFVGGKYVHSLKPRTNLDVYGEAITRTPDEAKGILQKLGFDKELLDEYHFIPLSGDDYARRVKALGGDFDATYGNVAPGVKTISFDKNIQSNLVSGESKIPVYVKKEVFESDESIAQVLSHEIYEVEELRYLAKNPITTKQYHDYVRPDNKNNLHYEAILEGDDMLNAFRKILNGGGN